MDHPVLQKRLIGGGVLLLLALIVVPFLMDDPRQEPQLVESNIKSWPQERPRPPIEVDEREFSPVVAPTESDPQEPLIPSTTEAFSPPPEVEPPPTAIPPVVSTKTVTPPSLKPRSETPTAGEKRWEVQVASYGLSRRSLAEKFLERMKAKGYHVELRKVGSNLRVVTAAVGSSSEARKLKKKIDRDFRVDKVQSMIRRLK